MNKLIADLGVSTGVISILGIIETIELSMLIFGW